jgi:hypothetical protein
MIVPGMAMSVRAPMIMSVVQFVIYLCLLIN